MQKQKHGRDPSGLAPLLFTETDDRLVAGCGHRSSTSLIVSRQNVRRTELGSCSFGLSLVVRQDLA